MQQIDNLTDQANQLTSVTLPDGSIVQLELIYRPTIQRWNLSASHPDLTVNGIDLCIHPNTLRQWRNLINFGLAVVSSDGVDPIAIDDFSTGRITLYILTAEEVQSVETTLFPAEPNE